MARTGMPEGWAAAHIDKQHVHLLEQHLTEVGRLAAEFASRFGSGEWGRLAGEWHDGGKYRPAFQQMIRAANGMDAHLETSNVPGRVAHSTAGALLARERFKNSGRALQLVIAGHHAGLSDPEDLTSRLDRCAEELEEARAGGWQPRDTQLPTPPTHLAGLQDRTTACRGFELWVRLLFSSLVDADFLDTEAFYDASRSQLRQQQQPSLAELSQLLDEHLSRMGAAAPPHPVQRVRARVLEEARTAARLPPGAFSLTVPTGGGKTLTSLSFALRHAVENGLDRVVVAIPYTSIIEQTAKVYRDILGDAVIEHHSALDPTRESRFNRIASENWDAPIIVTTNVQLFESLFANRPGRCRKLHRLVRSVIVLDEAQTLPLEFLIPILDVLQALRRDFGSSVLFCTATQPALRKSERRPWGMPDVREIVPDPAALADELRRVRFEMLGAPATPTPWGELAKHVNTHERALVITHQRRHARLLLEELDRLRGDRSAIHLSALMCAEHRSDVLGEIRQRLTEEGPIIVVSTQLVEAGVDIDFPVVFRALGGLDAIAQAAGRCNREGRLAEPGRVILFRAPEPPPPGALQQGLDAAMLMLAANANRDLLSPETLEEYSTRLYGAAVTDKHGIQTHRASLEFAQVAEKFRLIDEDGKVDILVPYGDQAPIDRLRANPSRTTLRGVQRKIVNVSQRTANAWLQRGALEDIDGLLIIAPGYEHLYDRRLGLRVDLDPMSDPTALIL